MSLEFRFSQRNIIISHISQVFHLQAQQFKSIVDLDSVLSFLNNSLFLIILDLSDLDVPKHSRFPLLPYLHIFICNISNNFLRNLQVEKESSSGIFHRIVLPFLGEWSVFRGVSHFPRRKLNLQHLLVVAQSVTDDNISVGKNLKSLA